MLIFKKVSYKNFLSTGNNPIEITLNTDKVTVVGGKNGCGKCLRKSTSFFDIEADDEIIKLLLDIEKEKNKSNL